jgi:orotidine-5'-phosphate decarboxylase
MVALITYNFYGDVWELIIRAENKVLVKEFYEKSEAAIFCDLKLIDAGYKLDGPLVFPY